MSFAIASSALKIGGTFYEYKGAQDDIKDMRKRAKSTLLTAQSNIIQNKLANRQRGFQTLEQGQQIASQLQRQGQVSQASAKSSASGSGAVVGSGTPRAVLDNIAQESLIAQKDAILNTRNALTAQKRETEAINKSLWNKATADASALRKGADKAHRNANVKLATGLLENVLDIGASVATAGTSDVVTKGLQVASTASTLKKASRQRRQYSPTTQQRKTLESQKFFNKRGESKSKWQRWLDNAIHNYKYAKFDSSKPISSIYSRKFNKAE